MGTSPGPTAAWGLCADLGAGWYTPPWGSPCCSPRNNNSSAGSQSAPLSRPPTSSAPLPLLMPPPAGSQLAHCASISRSRALAWPPPETWLSPHHTCCGAWGRRQLRWLIRPACCSLPSPSESGFILLFWALPLPISPGCKWDGGWNLGCPGPSGQGLRPTQG